jgi:uncharacterized protein (TIGR03086 family)
VTDKLDLHPPAREVTRLLGAITDDQLDAPTPGGATVAGILDHFMGLTLAFRDAATKRSGPDSPGGSADAANLHPAWRELLPQRLDELAAAWDDPEAWEGTTWAGGVEMPADAMAGVALDELVLHGWDLAKGTGQEFHLDPASLEATYAFTASMSEPGQEAGREGLFGPVVPVPEDAPRFDRALGYSGRDPGWQPPAD